MRYRLMVALPAIFLLFGMNGCTRDQDRNEFVGIWEIDKPRALAAMLDHHRRELGEPDRDQEHELVARMKAAWVEYKFFPDGLAIVSYVMHEDSTGFEHGTWRLDGHELVLEFKTTAPTAGERRLQITESGLSWINPAGIAWPLIRTSTDPRNA